MIQDLLFEHSAKLDSIGKSTEVSARDMIVSMINNIEGFKTKCKNLHWSAPKKNIHKYLDDFLSVLSDYQDSIAEDMMGIYGQLQPNEIKGGVCDCLNAIDFINEISRKTVDFYSNLPSDTSLVGIKSETENFIHNINKYKYLFGLCDIRPY